MLAGVLFFCFRRRSSDISAVEQYPAAGYQYPAAGYNDKPFGAVPVEYQQRNPMGTGGDIAGGRTYNGPEETGGRWVNGDDVAGGRVGRAF